MPPAHAGDIRQFPQSDSRKAIEMVRHLMQTDNAYARKFLRDEIRKLEPGLSFVDEALRLIVNDPKPWTLLPDRRSNVLWMVHRAVHKPNLWRASIESSLKSSIHANAQILLRKFHPASELQERMIEIYIALNLWDRSDADFLYQQVFNRYEVQFIESLFQFVDDISPTNKRYLAERVRNSKKKDALEYALFYRTGLMEKTDLIDLFRVFMANATEMNTKNGVFVDYRGTGLTVGPMLNSVINNLRLKLRAGDAQVTDAYHFVRTHKEWAGQVFLQDLWVGNLDMDCELRLHASEQDN